MSNFVIRLITGLVYVGVVLFVLLCYSGRGFLVFVSVVSALCLYEYSKMVKITRLQFVLVQLINLSVLFLPELWIFIPMAFVSIVLELFFNTRNPVDNLGKLFLGLVYISLPFVLIEKVDIQTVFIVFVIIWVNDSFAYLVGKKIGKTKLISHISPKKTVEGLSAGIIFSNIAVFILHNCGSNYTLGELILFANIICVTAVIGDLVESMLKRHYKVKDSGTILPGHGGVLDRLDSFIFAAPFVYTFTEIF